MRILSLFDGMACGHIAFDALEIPIERYVAYEIDKYAIKTAQHNFHDIEEMGDVFAADFSQYQGFDWLIGGSPCTHWSIAQTKHRETTASGIGWDLFSQYLRALRTVKPQCFLYENNKSMSPAIRAQITTELGVEPVLINSALVSAQSRQRLYWVGRRNPDGTYSQVVVQQPEDRGILLRDILETGVVWREKGYALTTAHKTTADDMIIRHQLNGVAEPIRIGTIENDAKKQDFDSQQYRVYSPDGKAVTLCGNGGGLGAKTGLYATPVDTTVDEWTLDMPVYQVRDGCIAIKGKACLIKLRDGCYIIRKLTVIECKRLQTVPDTYAFPVSNSQAYKMLGNGWTVEVIKHLITSALQDKEAIHCKSI